MCITVIYGFKVCLVFIIIIEAWSWKTNTGKRGNAVFFCAQNVTLTPNFAIIREERHTWFSTQFKLVGTRFPTWWL